ncbi:hypothetical protein BD408DRAFT_479867 [Parasitella parasitica]|nr:hypothetical protein BD408DRAFT_479867 [Parasitella parasitica]
MRIVTDPLLLDDLIASLSYYGRVLQLKQYTRGGFFEGNFSALIDNSIGTLVEGEHRPANPLDRMLYLCELDCFVAATFKGAPPVCHFCRHSGHIRAKCPELAKRRCFGCHKPGHMIRFCPEFDKQKQQADFAASVNSPATLSGFVDKEEFSDSEEDCVDNEESEDEEDEEELDNAESISSEAENDDKCLVDNMHEDVDENDEVVLAGDQKISPDRSSAYSKYASDTVAMNMKLDMPAELSTDAALRQVAKKKQAEFQSKLYGSTSATSNKEPTKGTLSLTANCLRPGCKTLDGMLREAIVAHLYYQKSYEK